MATRSLGTLTLDLVMKLGGFKQGAGQAEREFDKFSKSLQQKTRGLTNAVKGLGLSIVGGLGLNAIFQAVATSEKALAQLDAVIKSTGGVAGRSAEQLKALASDLQRVTTFGDEATVAMQSVLLTFTQVRGDQFDQATRAVLDMATALQMDLQAGALLVGKALNEPVRGLTAMTRAGIQFSAEQKKLIKDLVALGDVAGAQTIILKELEVQFGGSAEAARNTFSGALAALKNAVGDLLEGDGSFGAAASAVENLTSTLSDPRLKASFDALVGAILRVAGAFAEAISWFPRFGIGLGEALAKALSPKSLSVLQNIQDQITETIEDQQKLRSEIESLEAKQSRPLVRRALGFSESDVLDELARKREYLATLEARQQTLIKARTQELKEQSAIMSGVTGGVGGAARPSIAGRAGAEELKEIEAIYERNRTALEKYNDELAELNSLREKVGSKGERVLDDETYNRELARLQAERDKAMSGGKAGKSATAETEQATKRIQEFIDRLEEQRATLGLTESELLKYSITSGDVAEALALMGAAADPLREKLLALADATTADKAKADIEEQIKALQDQATQLSLTEEQAFAYSVTQGELAKQLALTGVDAERLTVALLEANNALAQARKELEQQAQRESIFEATRTDAERYAETLKDLGELFNASATDQDTYGRAVAGAVSEYITASNAVTEYRLRIEELNKMLADGTLTQDAFEAAVATVDETFAEAGREAAKAFADQAKRNTQDILANFLEEPFSRGIDGLVQDFDAMFRKIAAQAVAARIAEKLFDGFDDWIAQAGQMLKQFFSNMASSSSSSGWSSILGGIAGLFGGATGSSSIGTINGFDFSSIGLASGGYTGDGGKYEPAGIVHRGEYVVSADKVRQPGVYGFLDTLQRGSPERVKKQLRALELKVPRFSQGGFVGASIPTSMPTPTNAALNALNPGGSSMNVTQQFAISAPTGMVSAATQQQIAAAAARGLARASRRNN